jgi:hypothetical protein
MGDGSWGIAFSYEDATLTETERGGICVANPSERRQNIERVCAFTYSHLPSKLNRKRLPTTTTLCSIRVSELESTTDHGIAVVKDESINI